MPPPIAQDVTEVDPRGLSSTDGATDGEPAGEVELGHSVELEAFSGPLDLLLFLVRRAEVDVVDIPIATIADQFVDTVAGWNELDLDVAGEFILMAATLLEIKARLIAPPLEAPVDEDASEEDVVDLRAGLVGKLLAYRRFKEASYDLLAREDHQRHRHVRQLREEIPEDPEEAEGIDLDNADPYALASAWELVLKRINGLGPRTVINDTVPLESRVTEMLEHMRSSGHAFLKAIFASQPNRIARVTTFMALLECVRQRWIEAIQHGQYADVELRFRAESERAITEIAFAPEPEAKRRQRRPPLITWEGAPGAMTGDEDGEAPEEPQESDEQRFMRELEESSKVDSVLAWSADIELGFARFQAERRGEPWPPPKPVAPEPPPKPDAPEKPSWMAARAPARKPKEREAKDVEDKPAAVTVSTPVAAEGITPIDPTVAPVACVVPGVIAARDPEALAADASAIARAEPEAWVPIAAPAIADAAASQDGIRDVKPVIASIPDAPASQPIAAAPADDRASAVEPTGISAPEPIAAAPDSPAEATAIEPTTEAPIPDAPSAQPIAAASTDDRASPAEPAATDAPEPITASPDSPAAAPSVVSPVVNEPEPEPLQAAAFADVLPSVDDRVAVHLDDAPAAVVDESPRRAVEAIAVPADVLEDPAVAPGEDPILAGISDIELDPILEAPPAAPVVVEAPEAVEPAPAELAPAMSAASAPAPSAPDVIPVFRSAPPVIPSFVPVRSAPELPAARPTATPSAPTRPSPPAPSVRTAARREPTAIVMSTGRPADSRAQMRAAVASRKLRHRALALSATLLVIAAGCWIWARATAPTPSDGSGSTEVVGDDTGDVAPRVGAIPPLLAAKGDAIAIDPARLAAIPRLAAWTERVHLGADLADLPSWSSALFSDDAVPPAQEHWFVLAPKQSIATPAPEPTPERPSPPAVDAAPAAVVPPTAVVSAPDHATVAIAPSVTPVALPPEAMHVDAAAVVNAPARPTVIPTAGTLVAWPADGPAMVPGHAPGLHGWIGRLRATRHADAFAALLSEGVPAGATIAAPAEALPAFPYERDPMMSASAWLVIHAWDIAP